MIAVVDTGGANIASILNALGRLEKKGILTSDPEVIRQASHVILPGVGSAGTAMQKIESNGLKECIRSLKQPTLGICLGMQLLFDSSREGEVSCLEILPGKVTLIKPKGSLAVPHMGWNEVKNDGSALFRGLSSNFFYFVHSFVAPDGNWVTGRFDYGGTFVASVAKDNFFGVQFHPERSATAGHELLRNFVCL